MHMHMHMHWLRMCALARAEEEHKGADVEDGIEAAGHGEARVAVL